MDAGARGLRLARQGGTQALGQAHGGGRSWLPAVASGTRLAWQRGSGHCCAPPLQLPGGEPVSYEAARALFRRDPGHAWTAYVAGALVVLMRERGVRFDRGLSILVSSGVCVCVEEGGRPWREQRSAQHRVHPCTRAPRIFACGAWAGHAAGMLATAPVGALARQAPLSRITHLYLQRISCCWPAGSGWSRTSLLWGLSARVLPVVHTRPPLPPAVPAASADVPEGKGVSSSAAVEVATMAALAAALSIPMDGRTLALLCQRVENSVVGELTGHGQGWVRCPGGLRAARNSPESRCRRDSAAASRRSRPEAVAAPPLPKGPLSRMQRRGSARSRHAHTLAQHSCNNSPAHPKQPSAPRPHPLPTARAGAPCGVMDQMTAALGQEARLLALRCQPAEVQGGAAIPPHLQFWGVDSGALGREGGACCAQAGRAVSMPASSGRARLEGTLCAAREGMLRAAPSRQAGSGMHVIGGRARREQRALFA